MPVSNIDNLKAFIAVVEEGSFKKAAERLHVSQPTVSFRLRSLEEELKCRLLFRDNKKFQLTEIGRFTYQIGKEMLGLDNQLERYINTRLAGDGNRLVVGSGSTCGVYLLPHAISLFRREYPQAHIDLQISNSEKTLHKLLNNSIDIGVLGTTTKHEDIETFKFLEYELVLVAPAGHPLASVGIIKTVDLKAYPLIMREKGSLTRRIIEEALRRQGIAIRDLNIVMELNSTEALKVAVESGLGISFIAPWAIQPQLVAGNLVVVKIEDLSIRREVCVCINKRGILSNLGEKFLKFLRSRRLGKELQKFEGIISHPVNRWGWSEVR